MRKVNTKQIGLSLVIPMLLLLNETALYYYDLSSWPTERFKSSGLVNDWAKAVSHSKPNFPVSSKTTAATASSKSSTVDLTAFSAGETRSSKATSVNIKTSKSVKTLNKHDPSSKLPSLEVKDGAVSNGLFDEDEEPEHEATLSSPIKGRQRLTHQVCI